MNITEETTLDYPFNNSFWSQKKAKHNDSALDANKTHQDVDVHWPGAGAWQQVVPS